MKKIVIVLIAAALATGCANRAYTFRVDDTTDQSRVVTYRDAMEQAVANSRRSLLEAQGS